MKWVYTIEEADLSRKPFDYLCTAPSKKSASRCVI